MLEENINQMNKASSNKIGMDILIVSTGSKQQEAYWQSRLRNTLAHLVNPSIKIICIHEDWEGGAGNGLGTLYAYAKAREKAKKTYNIDIMAEQEKGAAIGIYHTAGQGKRLSPLTGSEFGNKPAVRLPGFIERSGSYELISILEAVIKQTSLYAASRKGRLSVFWGDQVFIPSNSCTYNPAHHIDILARFVPAPSREEWYAHGFDQYGLIGVDKDGNYKLLEKAGYGELETWTASGNFSIEKGLGLSLGSFSLSFPMTTALLDLFQNELLNRNDKLDSDPHFWMPMLLDKETYLKIMLSKKITEDKARSHFARMQNFKNELIDKHPEKKLFGAIDIGNKSFWWDYGTVDKYFENNIKLVGKDFEAICMRAFFGHKRLTPNNSVLLNCSIDSGTVHNSVLMNVRASYAEINDCMILNSKLNIITADQSLLYKVNDLNKIIIEPDSIRADVLLPDGKHVKLSAKLNSDPKTQWSKRLPGNAYSYEEVYQMTKDLECR